MTSVVIEEEEGKQGNRCITNVPHVRSIGQRKQLRGYRGFEAMSFCVTDRYTLATDVLLGSCRLKQFNGFICDPLS